MSGSINHAQIRRNAHLLGRTDSGWPNPFAHTWAKKRPSRFARWDDQVLEGNDPRASAPNLAPRLDTGDRLQFAATEPGHNHVTVIRDNSWERRDTEPEEPKEPEQLEQPEEPSIIFPKAQFTVGNQIRRIFLQSRINSLLLLCSPVGIALNFTKGRSVETFVLNFLSTIALNLLGDFAMTEVGVRLGLHLADLLCISTSNLVQLISCIVLLRNEQTTILKTSLIGGILANILFFLGISIVAGGISREYQNLNRTAAHMSSNLLSLASTSLPIPTASRLLSQATHDDLVKQSRGAAVILIVVYLLYVLCEQWTHKHVYSREPEKVPVKEKIRIKPQVPAAFIGPAILIGAGVMDEKDHLRIRDVVRHPTEEEEEDAEDPGPQLHILVATGLFAATTTLLYFHIDFAVNSIDALTEDAKLSKTFVGLILFPLSNCDYIPIILAMKDRLGQAVTVTVGKSIQTALLVMPLVVLLAWGMRVEQQVTLVFGGFEVVSLFATVLLLNLIISDAKVHWIQGVLLLADWALIAIAAFFVTMQDSDSLDIG